MKSTLSRFIKQFLTLGVLIGALVLVGVLSAAYLAPTAPAPGNNAETPLNVSSDTQQTQSLGVKNDTTGSYAFSVKEQSWLSGGLFAQQSLVSEGGVDQSDAVSLSLTPSTLDVEGNLVVSGSPSNSSGALVLDKKLDASSTIINTEPVCADQSGTLVRCTFPTGCVDPLAFNYDNTAILDDGSCTYEGCTDPNALNYDPSATVNGQCNYTQGQASFWIDNNNNQSLGTVSGCPGCTDDTFVVPAGVTSIDIEIYGAGGGGGAVNIPYTAYNNNPSANGRRLPGGGGAGGYLKVKDIPVTAGDSFPIAVGKGGFAGTPGPEPSCLNNNNGWGVLTGQPVVTSTGQTVYLGGSLFDFSSLCFDGRNGLAGQNSIFGVTRSTFSQLSTNPSAVVDGYIAAGGGRGGGGTSSCTPGLPGQGSFPILTSAPSGMPITAYNHYNILGGTVLNDSEGENGQQDTGSCNPSLWDAGNPYSSRIYGGQSAHWNSGTTYSIPTVAIGDGGHSGMLRAREGAPGTIGYQWPCSGVPGCYYEAEEPLRGGHGFVLVKWDETP